MLWMLYGRNSLEAGQESRETYTDSHSIWLSLTLDQTNLAAVSQG